MKSIKFYKTKTGQCPVEEFLDSLSTKQTKKVIWVLQVIEELENIPVTYLKKLVNTDDICEVRITSGGNIFQILVLWTVIIS